MNSLVSVENVYKTYHQGHVEVPALRGVSMDVAKGEFMALAGPNGSGKSTLLNLIGGLDSIDKGSIHIDGVEMTQLNETQKTKIRLNKVGFVFQAYNLIPVLSALENVEYVMLLQGVSAQERKARATEMLNQVGLEGLYHRRPSELSGGQQQRVAVARAIATQSEIILADEPTANLDSETASMLLDNMKQLNESLGLTFIFSTHDFHVMEYAHRIVYLHDGQIEKDEEK